MVLIPDLHRLYQAHVEDYQSSLDAITAAFGIEDSEQLIRFVQIAALFHDSGRQADGPDLWETQSGTHLDQYLTHLAPGIRPPHGFIQLLKLAVIHKDSRADFLRAVQPYRTTLTDGQIDYLRHLINTADTIEIIRCRTVFNGAYLPIQALPDSKMRSTTPAAKKQLQLELTRLISQTYWRALSQHRMENPECARQIHYFEETAEPPIDISIPRDFQAHPDYTAAVKSVFVSCGITEDQLIDPPPKVPGIERGFCAASDQRFAEKQQAHQRYYEGPPLYGPKPTGLYPDPKDCLETADVALLIQDYQRRKAGDPAYDLMHMFVVEDNQSFTQTEALLNQITLKDGENAKLMIKVTQAPGVLGLHYVPVYIQKIDGQIKMFIMDAGSGIGYEQRDGYQHLTHMLSRWAHAHTEPGKAIPLMIKTSTLTQSDLHNCSVYGIQAMRFFARHGARLFERIPTSDLVSGDQKIRDQADPTVHHLKADALPAHLLKLSSRSTAAQNDAGYQRLFGFTLPNDYYKDRTRALYADQESTIVSQKKQLNLKQYHAFYSATVVVSNGDRIEINTAAEQKMLAYRRAIPSILRGAVAAPPASQPAVPPVDQTAAVRGGVPILVANAPAHTPSRAPAPATDTPTQALTRPSPRFSLNPEIPVVIVLGLGFIVAGALIAGLIPGPGLFLSLPLIFIGVLLVSQALLVMPKQYLQKPDSKQPAQRSQASTDGPANPSPSTRNPALRFSWPPTPPQRPSPTLTRQCTNISPADAGPSRRPV
jgi:hypothetical protein